VVVDDFLSWLAATVVIDNFLGRFTAAMIVNDLFGGLSTAVVIDNLFGGTAAAVVINNLLRRLATAIVVRKAILRRDRTSGDAEDGDCEDDKVGKVATHAGCLCLCSSVVLLVTALLSATHLRGPEKKLRFISPFSFFRAMEFCDLTDVGLFLLRPSHRWLRAPKPAALT